MPFSQFLSAELLDWIKGNAFPSPPTVLAFALHNGNPGPLGASNNVQAAITGSAARTLISQLDLGSVFPITPEGYEVLNTVTLVITGAAVNTAPIVVSHISIWNAQSGGTLLAYGPIASPEEIQIGDLVKFDPATFSIATI